ncbi:MAG: hypothetical protein R3E79_47625 [Caldilineaceae bacterium]
MVLETLGTVKALGALKGAGVGLAAAVPALVNNSAIATHQVVTAMTPAVSQAATLAGKGWLPPAQLPSMAWRPPAPSPPKAPPPRPV